MLAIIGLGFLAWYGLKFYAFLSGAAICGQCRRQRHSCRCRHVHHHHHR